MINFMKLIFTVIIIHLFLISCSQDSTVDGGGGIETVAKTGVIVNESGAPAPQVEIKVYPEGYIPLVSEYDVKIYTDTTDDSGFYEIKIKQNNNYNIIGQSLQNGDKVLSQNISTESEITIDTLKKVGAVAVFIPEWVNKETGFVYIPGTNIYQPLANISSDSVLILNKVPAGLIDQISFYNDLSGVDTLIYKETPITVNSNDTIVMQYFGVVEQYSLNTGHLNSNRVHSITQDIYGNRWYATGTGGVSKYDGQKWTPFTKENSNLQTNHVYDLWACKNGDVWAGTVGGGVARYDGQSDDWQVWDTDNSDLINDSVYVVCGCSDCGGVWLGTDYGLMYKPESTDSGWMSFTADNSALTGDSIFSLVLDNCGHMYIGTNNGVSFWNGEIWKIWTPQNSNLPGSTVYGMVEDNNEILWVATDNGVAKYDGSKWEKIDPPLIEHDERYRALAISSRGELWAGSEGVGTLLRSYEGMKLLLSAEDLHLKYDLIRINDIFPVEGGRIEVATHYDGVLILDRTDLRGSVTNLSTKTDRRSLSTRF